MGKLFELISNFMRGVSFSLAEFAKGAGYALRQ